MEPKSLENGSGTHFIFQEDDNTVLSSLSDT